MSSSGSALELWEADKGIRTFPGLLRLVVNFLPEGHYAQLTSAVDVILNPPHGWLLQLVKSVSAALVLHTHTLVQDKDKFTLLLPVNLKLCFWCLILSKSLVSYVRTLFYHIPGTLVVAQVVLFVGKIDIVEVQLLFKVAVELCLKRIVECELLWCLDKLSEGIVTESRNWVAKSDVRMKELSPVGTNMHLSSGRPLVSSYEQPPWVSMSLKKVANWSLACNQWMFTDFSYTAIPFTGVMVQKFGNSSSAFLGLT